MHWHGELRLENVDFDGNTWLAQLLDGYGIASAHPDGCRDTV